MVVLTIYGVNRLKLNKFSQRHKELLTQFVVVGALCLLFYGYLTFLSSRVDKTPAFVQNSEQITHYYLTDKARAIECEFSESCRLLAEVGYYEARGEILDEAVAGTMFVVFNRRDNPNWGNTLHKVVYQPHQFSYTHDGSLKKGLQDKQSYDRMLLIAHYVWSGEIEDPTHGSDHYHNLAVKPHWRLKLKKTVKLGNHIYYRKT